MSTGYACWILEGTPGQWYYVLQRWDCPVGAGDWTEYAKVVGPFPTELLAEDGLSEAEANPGGWSVIYVNELSADRRARLVAKARAPRLRSARWGR